MAAHHRPNFLVIMADQHRYDCLGAYGNPDVRTPNVDRLAHDGVLYRNAFCTYPVCTPARYSLLTGLYARQHLGWTNYSTLPQGLATFPRMLRDAGYRTVAVGKMHFTPTYLDVGYDTMLLAEQDGPGRHDDDYHRYLRQRGLVDAIDLIDQVREYRRQAPREYWERYGAVRSDLTEADYSTTWIAEQALKQLRTWDGEGHLLTVSFIKPHHPFDPPAPWNTAYDLEELTLLPGWQEAGTPEDLAHVPGYLPNADLTEAQLRQVMAYYYGSISQIDHHVGRMIALLEEKGLYGDTLILYVSDHGEYMGYRHLLLKGGPMYEPLVRVPLICKYPGSLERGVISEALVSQIDVAPTLLAQAGCVPASSMRGLDLMAHPGGRDLVFAEHAMGQEVMVRNRAHKLLLARDAARCAYYDLASDPLEARNLFHEPGHRAAIEEARQSLGEWALFEAAPPVHLAEDAPTLCASNVPLPGDGHRAASERYFREAVASQLDGLDWA